MPLFKSITINSQTILKIWKITESYEQLLKPLNLKKESISRVEGMKSEIHRKGFLSVRHLLRAVGYTDQELYYDDIGRPHLKDGRYISISHSFIYSAVIIGVGPIGVDVEKQRDKIQLIRKKFIDYENLYLKPEGDDYVRKLTVLWCIKESLYKLSRTPGLSFKNNTLVIPFTFHDTSTYCWIDHKDLKERYTANYLEFNGFTCAYVTA